MKKFTVIILVALSLISSAPRPAHAGGADFLTIVASQLFGGVVRIVIGVGEFAIGSFLPDPEPKVAPTTEVPTVAAPEQVAVPMAEGKGEGGK